MKSAVSSQKGTDSEEENRRECEKIRQDILAELERREEPLTVLQLSYSTKYANKYCEEALTELLAQGKIK